jgi:hypothetical protein
LCGNCLVKYVIEGKIQGRGRRESRHKQLLDGLKENKIPEIEKG